MAVGLMSCLSMGSPSKAPCGRDRARVGYAAYKKLRCKHGMCLRPAPRISLDDQPTRQEYEAYAGSDCVSIHCLRAMKSNV